MKTKFLAAALAALGCASAFAAPLNPQTTTPAVVFYISGASAQKAALTAVVSSTVFATPGDVVAITGGNGSIGWLGMSIASLTGGTSKATLVVYNSTNGSAAGINQLLSTAVPPTEAEAKNISLPDGTCTALGAAPYTSTCTALAPLETDMALSDVQTGEFAGGIVKQGAGYLAVSGTTSVNTGLEGFGVIVNQQLYSALQNQNVADGLLPSTCAVAIPGIVTGGACQPSIRSGDYGTIAQSGGSFGGSEALALVPNEPTQKVTLCRRDDFSGSQAASNIQFLNSVCGTQGYFGAQTPQTDVTTTSLQVVAAANTGTGAAETCVKTANGNVNSYAMGVVSLGEKDEADVAYNGTKGYYFVKLDNVSPNFVGSTLDTLHRTSFMNANYNFAVDMAAITRNTIASPALDIANAMKTAIKNSTLHNLVGIGYIDNPLNWGVDGKNVKFDKGGNNCSKLH